MLIYVFQGIKFAVYDTKKKKKKEEEHEEKKILLFKQSIAQGNEDSVMHAGKSISVQGRRASKTMQGPKARDFEEKDTNEELRMTMQ